MKTKKFFLSLAILAGWAGMTLQAQSTEVISAVDFVKLRAANPDLVVIDANKPKEYNQKHITGAVNVNALDFNQGNDGPMKNYLDIALQLGKKGIHPNQSIVVYDEGSQKNAARLFFILRYLGAKEVKLLHQEPEAWAAAGITTDDVERVLPPTAFPVALNKNMVIDLKELEAKVDQPDVIVVDTRSRMEYKGDTEVSKGHIPNAINFDFYLLVTIDGRFKSKEQLQEFATGWGITPDKDVVLYCKSGLKASVVYVALKHLLGYEKVRLYTGNYAEWASKNPVNQ